MSIAAVNSAGSDEHGSTNLDERLLVPIPQAMTALGVGRTKLYELMDAREILKVNIGRRSFVTAKSLAGYVDRLSDAAAAGVA
ncbi:DNA-binding protein [Mycobacterium sp. UM_CSW]|uniref:DNA-binding protein n=1 Tax=Mycobacterium sp. UM_CSW TaxID=1370119 RepID=UPI0019553C61|nr:DNA-binding protein [Mycobacterium sp. UM_CSW]